MAAPSVNAIYSGSVTYLTGDGVTPPAISLGGTVDASKCVVVLTVRDSDNQGRAARHTFGYTITSNTIAFQRASSAFAQPVTLEWQVIEYSAGVNVQRGRKSVSAVSETASITAVDSTKSVINLVGFQTSNNSGYRYQGARNFSTNVSGNDQVTFNLNSAITLGESVQDWEVIEFEQDVIVQRGQVLSTSSGTTPVTLTAVDLTATMNTHEGLTTSQTSTGRDNYVYSLASTTQLDVSNIYAGTSFTTNLYWAIVEFTGGQKVEYGVVSQPIGTSSTNVSFTAMTTPSVGFLSSLNPFNPNTGAEQSALPQEFIFATSLVDNSTVNVQRNSSANPYNTYWSVVEWDVGGGGGLVITSIAIASAESFGTPAFTTGVVTLSPTAIATAEALGNPTLSQGATFINPLAINTEEFIGVPVVTPQGVIITPTAIPTGASVGNPDVSVGLTLVFPEQIFTEEFVGEPQLEMLLKQIFPTGIITAQLVGRPLVLGGDSIVIPIESRVTWNAVAKYLRELVFKGADNDVIMAWMRSEGFEEAYNDNWEDYLLSEGYLTGSQADRYAAWRRGEVGIADPWILTSGSWDDSRIWVDTATWKDN